MRRRRQMQAGPEANRTYALWTRSRARAVGTAAGCGGGRPGRLHRRGCARDREDRGVAGIRRRRSPARVPGSRAAWGAVLGLTDSRRAGADRSPARASDRRIDTRSIAGGRARGRGPYQSGDRASASHERSDRGVSPESGIPPARRELALGGGGRVGLVRRAPAVGPSSDGAAP